MVQHFKIFENMVSIIYNNSKNKILNNYIIKLKKGDMLGESS